MQADLLSEFSLSVLCNQQHYVATCCFLWDINCKVVLTSTLMLSIYTISVEKVYRCPSSVSDFDYYFMKSLCKAQVHSNTFYDLNFMFVKIRSLFRKFKRVFSQWSFHCWVGVFWTRYILYTCRHHLSHNCNHNVVPTVVSTCDYPVCM